jgi:glycosyltransferase involved in cell wall biosynthesis
VVINPSRLAYLSFDTVPSPKGAAIHIAAFSQTLVAAFGDIDLVTVSPTAEGTTSQKLYPGVIQTTLPALGDTLINRVLYFRTLLGNWCQGRWFEAVQIRSIYEGYPIALNKQKLCNFLIFEVNGLPSIELKYRYPAVADDPELLQKLRAQEKICLEASDLIVTPSRVTGDYLQSRGVAAQKIRVIPNGVDLDVFAYDVPVNKIKDSRQNPFHLLYFGTLSAWQGVHLAVEALALICQDFPAKLVVIGPTRDRQVQNLQQLAVKLGVVNSFTVLPSVSQAELVQHIHAAHAIVAPLTPNDRNMVQGCCPLKVLEGMATGTPVITSDLPVVRELGENGLHFLLVKPGSAKAIKDAVLRLQTESELTMQLAVAAREKIEANYTWKQAGDTLIDAYENLGIKRDKTACSPIFSCSSENSA